MCFSLISFLLFQTPRLGIADADAGGRSPVYLRVLDPSRSLVTEIETPAQLNATALDHPAVQVLLAEMRQDAAMYLTFPMAEMAAAQTHADGVLLVGSQPLPELPASVAGELVLIGDSAQNPILGMPIRYLSHPKPEYVLDGSGFHHDIGSVPLGILSVDDLLRIGIHVELSVGQFVSSFTCLDCPVTKVEELAARMTTADRQAGGAAIYYAVAAEDLENPASTYYEASSFVRDIQLGVACSAAVLIAAIGATQLWSRRRGSYRIDLISGSPRWHIHVRTQALLALAVSLPTIAAPVGLWTIGEAINAQFNMTQVEVFVLCSAPALVHVGLGVPLAWAVERLCKRLDD